MKDDLLKILLHYGTRKQLKHWHSEVFELVEAVIDYMNLVEEDDIDVSTYVKEEEERKNHITEELADNFVMLKQFQHRFGIENSEIEKIMKEKIDRQLRRIEEENNAIKERDTRE